MPDDRVQLLRLLIGEPSAADLAVPGEGAGRRDVTTVMTAVGAAAIAGAAGVVLLRRRFVVVQVVGESMVPVLSSGQRVLVRRAVVAAVNRDDLVVFALGSVRERFSGDPPWMVKRAIAVPGDPVPGGSVPSSIAAGTTRVPPGQLVVRGDNGARSYDSRRAGFIGGGTLLGVVVRTLRHDQ
jgi:signal peptidase I